MTTQFCVTVSNDEFFFFQNQKRLRIKSEFLIEFFRVGFLLESIWGCYHIYYVILHQIYVFTIFYRLVLHSTC